MFSINSVKSDRVLIFSHRVGEFFRAELKGHDLSASIKVSTYTDNDGLNQLFQELGSSERPWQGEKSWSSLEGEFTLSATCSSLGVVCFYVSLRAFPGAPEEWSVEAGLETEFGQLAKIAKWSDAFFHATNT
jgi:hypothetical protein